MRTLANMVEWLGDEIKFKIVTSDRDAQDTEPYSGVIVNDWNSIGKAEALYMSPQRRSLTDIRKIICGSEYDVLYLNSFISPFTINPLLLRWLKLIPDKPIVLAPRGEFSAGALSLKKYKKRLYIEVAKLIGLYRNAVWQASSEFEKLDIQRWFGNSQNIFIAPDLPAPSREIKNIALKRKKSKGCLKLIFLSRIARMKNLHSALKILNSLKGLVNFNIYGPIEDKAYWLECQKIAASLPENIKAKYCGQLAHEQVPDAFGEHDFLLLPTLGENFGHVILEAFCAGCPVLISDQTRWRNLEKNGIGWDLPLDRPELFKKALQQCIDMDNVEHEKLSSRAQEYGLNVSKDNKMAEQNRRLFQFAMGEIQDKLK